MIYSSKNNDLIKKIISLKEKKYRYQYNEYFVEGIKMVNEAIKFNQKIELIVLSSNFDASNLNFNNFKTITVTEDVFLKISDEQTPQGILAIIKISEMKKFDNKNSCLFLNKISDPGNLGTIIRTAAACSITDIILDNCVDPYNTKTVRASMSGIYFINFHNITNISEIEMPLISADMNGENLFEFSPPQKFCLVIGNEANGITKQIKDKSKYIVKIPMENNIESLNAAISAGIIMYNLKFKNYKEK